MAEACYVLHVVSTVRRALDADDDDDDDDGALSSSLSYEDALAVECTARHLSAARHLRREGDGDGDDRTECIYDFFDTPRRRKYLRSVCCYAGVTHVRWGGDAHVTAVGDLAPAIFGGKALPPGLSDDDKSFLSPSFPAPLREQLATAPIYTHQGLLSALEGEEGVRRDYTPRRMTRADAGLIRRGGVIFRSGGFGATAAAESEFFLLLAMHDGQPMLVPRGEQVAAAARSVAVGVFGQYRMTPGLVLLVLLWGGRLEIVDVVRPRSGDDATQRLARSKDDVRVLLDQGIPCLHVANLSRLPVRWDGHARAVWLRLMERFDAAGGVLFFVPEPCHVPKAGDWMRTGSE